MHRPPIFEDGFRFLEEPKDEGVGTDAALVACGETFGAPERKGISLDAGFFSSELFLSVCWSCDGS